MNPRTNICDETVYDFSQVPRGAWSITIIEMTGQTWTVPNELGPDMKPADNWGYTTESTDNDFKADRQFNWVMITN